jgi:hypothetical protein
MDTHASHSDDLTPLEARLAHLRPSTDGLSPDAMLFAAGRASVARGRTNVAWPIISACLALVAVTLGVRLGAERSERLSLLEQLQRQPNELLPAAPLIADRTRSVEPLAPDSYLALSREWYGHPDEIAVKPDVSNPKATRPVSPDAPILRAWPPSPAESL